MRPLLLVVCLLVPCLPAFAGDKPPTREALERDLVIEATLASPKVIQPGEPVRVRSRLVNRSKTVTYKVVRPGDGSESGWREPHVFFTAETIAKDGARTKVPEAGLGRCGLYDANWHDEVVELAPGKSLDLYNWMPTAHLHLLFQHEGTVELKLHYRYTAGAASKGRESLDGPVPQGAGPMKGTPAFEVISAPVRFQVTRLMDIRLEITKPMIVGKEMKLSEIAKLHIENRSNDPVPVSGSEVTIELLQPGGATAFFTSFAPIAPSVEAKTPALGGGDTRTWAGATKWQALPDWRMTPARPGSFKVVATWRTTSGQAYYRSDPATVEVRAP